jgi:benzodiazapine receptor
MKNIWKLIISLVIVFAISAIGSLFTANSVNTWFLTLAKPSFNPPSWVFGPVWTILYIMIGISLFLIWKAKTKSPKKTAYWVFGVQIILNALWSIAFFGMQNPGLAFLVIALLWISIIINAILFYKISKPAGYLLIPYWLWVSFASALNFAIWMLN